MTEHTDTKPWKRLAGLWRDATGGVAIIFALSATVLVAFLGAGLDLSRAYVARQQLSNVATLTCQYSARPSVFSTAYTDGNGVTSYNTQVNNFATLMLTRQNFTLTQTDSAPFNYTGYGGTSSVTLNSSVPTLFLPIVGIRSLPVGVAMSCATGITQSNSGGSSLVLSESFENSACNGTCWSSFQPSGTRNTFISSPVNTFPSTTGYVGETNSEWTIMGYCVEIDTVGLIKSTVPDGTHSAELDCDNGSGTAGNSSISNKTYYTTGTYEIRYSYAGRVEYPNYDPAYICGSTAADNAWANDTNSSGSPVSNASRSNQMNVYFDADNNGAPATHTTLDGTQTLAGSNLIDQCVYSINWVQRSVKVTITTAGYYWLSFAADGQNDSYGAQVDNIMVCRTSCTGSVSDNFPGAWTTTPLLFEDTFESPAYTGNYQVTENLNTSYGTSASGGWPSATQTGWATGPYNQVEYIRSTYAGQGSQSLQLDSKSVSSVSRRSISRYFYLDPGYYQISYKYIGDEKYGTYSPPTCTAAPTSLSSYVLSGTPTGTVTNRVTGGTVSSSAKDANAIAVFMSQSMEASYPSGGGAQDSQTSYVNPDGTTSTTPTVAPDGLTLSTYNGSQVNPVLDYCNYQSAWTTRTVNVKITKSGQYWLTFSSHAASSNNAIGGAIDDVTITALNSLYGTAASSAVTIPTASATPGSTISYTGFTFIADPLTP